MKLFLTIAAIFTCIVTHSQISFDVNAGINIGNLHTKINADKQKGLKPAIGYTIPLHINIPVAKSLIFQTGLEYESVHHKLHGSYYYTEDFYEVVDVFTAKSHLDYINIPLKIYYKINPVFRLGFGPFIGVGMGGRDKTTDVVSTTSAYGTTTEVHNSNEKVKFGSKNSEVKRFNIGLGLNLAYTFSKKIILGLYSNLGLTSISNYDSVKSRTFTGGLTVGYIFGKKASK